MNPQGEAFDPEEDEPVLEVAWPYIQVQRSRKLLTTINPATDQQPCPIPVALPPHPSGSRTLEAHQQLPPDAYFQPKSPSEKPVWRCGIKHPMGYYYNARDCNYHGENGVRFLHRGSVSDAVGRISSVWPWSINSVRWTISVRWTSSA
jgi:hypothetical protein